MSDGRLEMMKNLLFEAMNPSKAKFKHIMLFLQAGA
jgi:hypothetical protein